MSPPWMSRALPGAFLSGVQTLSFKGLLWKCPWGWKYPRVSKPPLSSGDCFSGRENMGNPQSLERQRGLETLLKTHEGAPPKKLCRKADAL